MKFQYCLHRMVDDQLICSVVTWLLALSQTSPGFLHVFCTSLLKTLWDKEKLLETSNFSFSHDVLYPFYELSAILIKLQNCCLQSLSVLKSLKFVIWERVTLLH